MAIIIALLSFIVLYIMKKATYISDKEKEFVLFSIDMFIEHSHKFNITSKDQQEKLIKELEKIKDKYFKISHR